MTKIRQTSEIIRRVRDRADTAVMFHSANGKDSIALCDMLAHTFERVICVYMYFVDPLRHIEAYIRWATEYYPRVSFVKVEHPMAADWRRLGLFRSTSDDETETIRLGELEERVMKHFGVEYAFSGMKAVDGFMKRMRLKLWQPWYTSPRGMVYPLALWTNKEVLHYIRTRKLIQPTVYDPRAVSQGITADYHVLTYLRTHFPDDYQRILAAYPDADIAIYDYERKQDKADTAADGK